MWRATAKEPDMTWVETLVTGLVVDMNQGKATVDISVIIIADR